MKARCYHGGMHSKWKMHIRTGAHKEKQAYLESYSMPALFLPLAAGCALARKTWSETELNINTPPRPQAAL